MPLARTARVTIWTSGPFCVQAPCGSAMSPFGSVTRPLMLCCLWRASSTAGPSTVREKCTAWWSAARTATGERWRASSWNPVRLDPEISAVHYTLSFREMLHTSWPVFTNWPRKWTLSCSEKQFDKLNCASCSFLTLEAYHFILHSIHHCSKVLDQFLSFKKSMLFFFSKDTLNCKINSSNNPEKIFFTKILSSTTIFNCFLCSKSAYKNGY